MNPASQGNAPAMIDLSPKGLVKMRSDVQFAVKQLDDPPSLPLDTILALIDALEEARGRRTMTASSLAGSIEAQARAIAEPCDEITRRG